MEHSIDKPRRFECLDGGRETEPEIIVWFGDKPARLTRLNTFLRMFEAGDGVYDHWIHLGEGEEGEMTVFTPSPELLRRLVEGGFSAVCESQPDGIAFEFLGETHIDHMPNPTPPPRHLRLVARNETPPPPVVA